MYYNSHINTVRVQRKIDPLVTTESYEKYNLNVIRLKLRKNTKTSSFEVFHIIIVRKYQVK